MNKRTTNNIMIWLWRIWSLIYFALLFYIVFLARRRPAPTLSRHPKIEPNLIPFKHKWHVLTHHAAVAGDGFYMDIMGNIVMFIPLALFLYIVYGVRKLWLIVVFAFAVSTAIECVQYVTSIGKPDIDDVCLNTFGALLGVLVIDGVKRVVKLK